ncbi:MAG: 30S ribosome-binding factor RbfA [Leptospirales bacterium]|jgi:ribosome-binding factor A
MKPLRKQRLESAMMKAFATLIMKRKAKDERLGLVSVTGVDLAPDLSSAIIRVSLFGTEEENRDTWKGLAANLKFFQSQIGKDMRLRNTPRMEYALDTSIAEGDRVIEMIERDRPEGEADSASPWPG